MILRVIGLAVILSQGSGSKIEFTVTQDYVAPPLTESLSMTCSLENTAVVPDDTNDTDRKRRDVEETDEDMIIITSILISRNKGEKVAHISQFAPAEVLIDIDNLRATGDISGKSGNRAYLQLDWAAPNGDQAHSYVCEILTQDVDGHTIPFRKPTSVSYKEPKLDEVIKELVKLQNGMRERIPAQTQRGTGVCKDSNNWSPGPKDNPEKGAVYTSVTTTFDKPYLTPPVFSVGFKVLDTLSANSVVRVNLTVRAVTARGFTVECITWMGSQVNDVEFDWLALSG